MKINPKSEKGAITLIVLVTMLFLISFLISMYIRTANKAQISAETTEQIKQKYNNIGDEEQIYNSYFIADNVIPIIKDEDFMNIDKEEVTEFTINDKTYKKKENSVYILMEDIEINASKYPELTGQEIYNKICNVAKFEGNGYTITVSNLQGKSYAFLEENLWLNPISAGEYAEITSIYKDINEDIAIIPQGFNISNVPEEQTIESGLVITTEVDENGNSIGNELVWIPIENVNDMFMCQAKTEDTICDLALDREGKPYCKLHNGTNSELAKKMAGRLYSGASNANFDLSLTNQVYIPNSGKGEPVLVTGRKVGAQKLEDEAYNNLNIMKTILEVTDDSYDNSANFLNSLQEEYNNIVTSVIKYKGFFVGRYETSGMVNDLVPGTIKIQKEIIPSTNVPWYNMYAQQKKYVESLDCYGGMTQGAAHDQVLKFVNVNNFSTKSGTVGDRSGVYASGTKTEDISKNICDLRGNCCEWTTESSDDRTRTCRGSYYLYAYSASRRGGYVPYVASYDNVGSRAALYIK